MKTCWKITHDSLRLIEREPAATLFEEMAREQGEDVLQAEFLSPEKRRVLDLGWYRDRYLVSLVEDGGWDMPIERIDCHDLKSALETFRRLTA
ncbi:MAG: hypothetical protein IPL39_16100 [Opitutaceae bacterium]|nr:hypothetical protein [Opitutaceae bacterium]